jgi:hypothetical protein
MQLADVHQMARDARKSGKSKIELCPAEFQIVKQAYFGDVSAHRRTESVNEQNRRFSAWGVQFAQIGRDAS